MIDIEQNPERITDNFHFDTTKGLNLGGIKPPSNTAVPLNTFHYQGSYTKPPCDENVFWYVNNSYLSVKTKTLDLLKNYYLTNETTFPEKKNARSNKSHQDFKMIEMPLNALKGQETHAPVFV